MKNQTIISASSALPCTNKAIFTARLLSAFLLLCSMQASHAGSATWNSSPTSGDWNTAANWTPATVPNGPSDTATFASSSVTGISTSAATTVNGIVFNAGASAFTITTNSQSALLGITGVGITNNSGILQNLVADSTSVDVGTIDFSNNATAGSSTSFTIAGGRIASAPPPEIEFATTSSAGTAVITVNGGVIALANGGILDFNDSATAANATITVNGSAVANATGGVVEFDTSSTAGAAVVIVNGGTHGGGGGLISFNNASTGGTSRIELSGNGTLDISHRNIPGVTVGSIEGSGLVTLGGNNLTVGGSNLTTTFSGQISDNGTSGSLTKLGRGKLTLSNSNTYAGGTTVSKGTLIVTNKTDSATGTGAVQVRAGTFGGTGTVSGAVTVANGSTTAILSPGSGVKPGTVTILSSVTLNPRATYRVDLNSTTVIADQVVANGVTIVSGAGVSVDDLGTATLPAGTVFTIISNTSANPIAGTFIDLPDGSTLTVRNNTYQASYEGGDGNDLTLTVVP